MSDIVWFIEFVGVKLGINKFGFGVFVILLFIR